MPIKKVPVPKKAPKKEDVSLVDIMRWAGTAKDSWLEKNTEAEVQKQVHKILDERKTMVVAKLLGFDSRWGEWEVDHCNGRAGNSIAGQYLASVASREIKKWMEGMCWEDFDGVIMAALEKAVKAELGARFREQMTQVVRERVHDVLREYVNDEVVKVLADKPYEVLKQLENI